MQLNIIAIAFILTAIVGAFIREIAGNKGIFVLPKITDKGLALGSLAALIFGFGLALGQITVVLTISDTITAIFTGFWTGWGGSDAIANFLSYKYEKKNGS